MYVVNHEVYQSSIIKEGVRFDSVSRKIGRVRLYEMLR